MARPSRISHVHAVSHALSRAGCMPPLHADAAIPNCSGTHAPTSQCRTSSSIIGKSETFAVANAAPTPTADAAIRQSAWWRVMPRSAYSRRHRPARAASAACKGASRSARTRRRAVDSSPGRRPRHISSIEITDTHGSTPTRLSPLTRSAAGRPLSASIRTVESSNSRDMLSRTAESLHCAAPGPSPRDPRPTRGLCRRLSPRMLRCRPSDARHQGRAGLARR